MIHFNQHIIILDYYSFQAAKYDVSSSESRMINASCTTWGRLPYVNYSFM